MQRVEREREKEFAGNYEEMERFYEELGIKKNISGEKDHDKFTKG
jgi:hypothetical protein